MDFIPIIIKKMIIFFCFDKIMFTRKNFIIFLINIDFFKIVYIIFVVGNFFYFYSFITFIAFLIVMIYCYKYFFKLYIYICMKWIWLIAICMFQIKTNIENKRNVQYFVLVFPKSKWFHEIPSIYIYVIVIIMKNMKFL